MRSQYDEDLESNSFFLAFKSQQKVLFDNAIRKNWIIVIPCSGSFVKDKYDDFDFLNHVLVPIIDESLSNSDSNYKTLGNQKVKISATSIVLYSKEPEILKEIQVLFDETFYTEDDKTYKVYCISEPINSEASKIERKNENGKVFSLNSVADSKSFLWKIMAKPNTKVKVDAFISDFKTKIQKLHNPTVQDCFTIMKELYVLTHQTIASHKTYKKMVSKSDNLKNCMKLALEMYLCNTLFPVLFAALTDATADKDEELNRSTRIFQNIRASKSGIRFDVCENIPKARKELSLIRKISTPLEICESIRKVIAELSSFRKPRYSISSPNSEMPSLLTNSSIYDQRLSTSASGLMVTSDDLLSALIFLVIKSDIPNWYTYLEYANNFRFAPCSRDDEYHYYLTTLEATLEHIRNMATSTVEEDLIMDVSVTLSLGSADSSVSNYNDVLQSSLSSSRVGLVAYELNQIRQLFRLIESGQVSAVKEMIQRCNRIEPSIGRRTVGPSNFTNAQNHYCHPLCDCKAVVVDRKSCQSLVERSQRFLDIQLIPASKTFDTAETAQKKYIIDNHNSQPSSFSLTSVDDRGWNVLHQAAHCGQIEIVNILLEYPYLLDLINLEGETAIHLAARKGHQDVILKLLDTGAEINIQNYSGQTALHIAVEYDHLPCVSTLIYFGGLQSSLLINCVNNSGNTALHVAAMWGYESIVNCLLDNNASAIIKNNKGFRPADIASTRKLIRHIKIIAQKQEIASVSKEAVSAIAKLMEPVNKDTNSPGLKHSKQKSLVNSKTKKMMEQIPKDLLKSNQPVVITDSQTRKIEKLLKVVADGDLQMLKFLLEITDDESELPLAVNNQQELCHPLCQCSRCSPFQQLMIKLTNKQLNVNSTNKEGFCSLHIAAIHDRSTIAKFLLHYGADPAARTNKLELTPIHLASIYGSIKVLNVLLSHKGVNINVLDKKLNTPLSYACIKEKIEVVDTLIQGGALINTPNHRGNTPLHEAVRHNSADIVNLLIKNGADLDCLNSKGLSPLDLSKDLNIYFILKNASKAKGVKNNSETEREISELEVISSNSRFFTNQNVLNIDSDIISINSDISIASSEDKDGIVTSDDRLFPDELKFDFKSQLFLEKSESPTNDVDTELLERVEKNSKYNYRLTFKDPNSPSVSSTSSSK